MVPNRVSIPTRKEGVETMDVYIGKGISLAVDANAIPANAMAPPRNSNMPSTTGSEAPPIRPSSFARPATTNSPASSPVGT